MEVLEQTTNPIFLKAFAFAVDDPNCIDIGFPACIQVLF